MERRFTSIYGWAKTQYESRTSKMVADLKYHASLPWLIGSDLNEILHYAKKQGGPPKSQNQIDSFQDAIVNNGLFELGYIGCDFT